MIGILLGLGIVLNFFICAFLLEERDIIKSGILSVFLFFCYYVIIGGLLFGLDIFSIEKVMVVIALAEGIFLVIIKRNKKLKLEWTVQKYIFPIVLTVCVFPFVWNKFGFHGMGQDEGVYQTQAIAFMNHHYENQKDFLEYELLDETEKENFKQFVASRLVGYYVYDETLPTLPEEEKLSDVSGFYHGIPTFSAVLALWGKLFGMRHMAGIQTVFYVCSLFLLFFTCENLHLKKHVEYIAGILYMCSPILIWVSKSSLTEIFLACIIIGFLYFMTGKGSNGEIGYAALTVVTFTFYHLTIYTMLPIFVLVFWGMYLYSRNRSYIYATVFLFLFFMISMINVSKIAATYCYVYNYWPLYRMAGFINQETVLPILISVSILGVLLSLGILIYGGKFSGILSKTRCIWQNCISLIIILFVIVQIHIVTGFMADGFETLLKALQNSTFAGFVMYGGGALLVLSIIYIFFKPSICMKSTHIMIITGMFVYCVLFYTCFLRKNIPFHYYYGRYLAPFICIVVLTIGIVADECNKFQWRVMEWLMVFGYAAVCMPFNLVLATNNDDTRMSWDVMEDIAEIIPENATVYMDYDIGILLYLPLRELANVNILPVRSEVQQEKLNSINNDEQDIYYIAEINQYLPMCDVVYGNWYETSDDGNKFNGEIMPLPHRMEKENKNIAVYKVLKEKYQYQFAEQDFMLGGYYSLESDFRWSSPIENVLRCILHKNDYIVRVEQGSIVPLNELGREKYEVKLEINGQYIDSCTITREQLDSDMIFKVPEEMIEEGSNEVSFICDPWSPQDYGVPDSRILGIAIKQVVFEPCYE